MKGTLILLIIIMLFSCREKVDLDGAFDGDTYGCTDFLVYQMTSNQTMGIAIMGDTSALGLTKDYQTFDINNFTDEELYIVVDEFRSNIGYFSCFTPYQKGVNTTHRWEAVSGTVQIKNNGWVNENEGTYSLSFLLEDVLFRHDLKDSEVSLKSYELLDITVGN